MAERTGKPALRDQHVQPGTRRKITIDRVLAASAAEVWTMWTTKEGIESWWGPDGFTVEVRELDLRTGGMLVYAMKATGPDQVAFMKRAGMPLTTVSKCTYTEVRPPRRLAYTHPVDFVPGVSAYDVEIAVELLDAPGGTRLVLRIDAMHDEEWTQRAVTGWTMELGKLEKALRARV